MTDMSNSRPHRQAAAAATRGPRFLTGAGQYTDDVVLPARPSASSCARPSRMRASSRSHRSRQGRQAWSPILTGADLAGIGGLPCGWLIHSKDGTPMVGAAAPGPGAGQVRHVGDQVALVVAETLLQAKDAAERIEVDYEAAGAGHHLPSTHGGLGGARRGAQQRLLRLGPRRQGTAVDAAFAKAPPRHAPELRQQPADPERDGAARANAHYTKHDDQYTLWVANQNPHVERLLMSAFVLGLPESKVRVIAPDVGGGFGSKIFLYPEETSCSSGRASASAGRSKRTAERSESFLTDAHGRDHHTKVELAMDAAATSSPAREHGRQHGGVPVDVRVGACRPSPTPRCSPASTRRRRSTPRSGRCSPTPRRWMPTAAPGGRRRPTWSSASSRPPRAR